jgi:hypothetical protein
MANAAFRGKGRGTTRRITLENRNAWKTLAFDLRENRIATGEERHIGNDVAHVATLRNQRLSVHAALEAIVDPVLDDLNSSHARPVLRESRVNADPGHRVTPRAVIGVAAHAL